MYALPPGQTTGTPKTSNTSDPGPTTAEDADRALLSTITFPDDMVGTVFAREPNVQDPTAISIDEQNRVYIAETHRFARGVEDNRRNGHWLRDDIGSTSTADRLAMYQKHASKKPMEYYTRYSEKIRRIEDRDGDGKCDFGQVYAEGFNDPLDGTAAGIMAFNGKVYFACIPHVWLLEDVDDDGVADKRESLQEGFGISVSLSGHDLNGFVLGPDGRVYFTIGDRAYNLKTKDGRHLYDQYAGAIFRMEPDGSQLEVVHTGLRNPKEIAFDQFGAAFSVDNNADMGDLARVVYMVEGADSGWNRGHQNFTNFTNSIDISRRHKTPWMEEMAWKKKSLNRPDAFLPPAAHVSKGPSGLTYNPGTGLGEKWDNHFFVCDYQGNSKVIGFEMKPQGAGYELASEEDFIKGFLNTDIEFGYDGKVYVSDYTGNWMTHGFGTIFTFHNDKEIKKPAVAETRKLFADGFEKLGTGKLGKLLHHIDMRVRMRAQFTLAAQGDTHPIFLAATAAENQVVTRLHGVWGLGQLARQHKSAQAAASLAMLADDPSWRVRGQALQALGQADAKSMSKAMRDILAAHLNDANANTAMLAAIALGKAGHADDIPKLIELLVRNDDADAYLRHGAIQALQTIVVASDSADTLLQFKNHPSAAVRRGLVITLRRLKHPAIAHFLKDKDDSIVIETIQAINDAYIEDARPALAQLTHWLGKSTPMIDYRIINAIFRVGGHDGARQILKLLTDKSQSPDVRMECLFVLNRWEKPPIADPTSGKYRPVSGDRDLSALRPEIIRVLKELLDQAEGMLLADVIRTTKDFKIKIPSATLATHLSNPKNTTAIRLIALDSLLSQNDPRLPELLSKSLNDGDRDVRVKSFATLAKLDPGAAIEQARKILVSNETYDIQQALATLATMAHADAGPILLDQLQRIKQQPAAIQLDIIEAAALRKEPEIAKALKDYHASIDTSNPVNAFRVTLEGGDVGRGRRTFYNHGAAECTRCHKGSRDRRGGDAGPGLWNVGKLYDREYLLEAMVSPAAQIAPGYGTISLSMNDGSIIVGRLAKQDDKRVTITDDATQKTTEYDRKLIKKMSAPVSIMPPVAYILSKKELRDVIAYLASLKE